MAELTTVATYPQAFLAHAARNYLAEQGVRSFVADEFTTDQSWSNYIEAKLQVAAEDAPRAASLLVAVEIIQ